MPIFFDEHDDFYRTSETSPYPHRLTVRYTATIEKNKNPHNISF